MDIVNTVDKIKEFISPDILNKEEIDIDKDSDKVLNAKLELRIGEASDIRKQKLRDWRTYLKFFDGDHWQVSGIQLPSYKANMVINKIFAALRSLVAYETDTKPQPVVDANITKDIPNPEEIIAVIKKLESNLDYKWDLRQIPSILTEIYYDRYLFSDGYGMPFWNAIDDDVDFELVKPQEILRSPGSTSVDDAEYIIIEKWRNRKYFEDNYPDLIEKIKFVNSIDLEAPGEPMKEKAMRENVAKVHYYFQDDIWVFRCGDVILDKKRNAYWEWRTPEEQETEIRERFKLNSEDPIPLKWKPVKNHLKKPKKPIIQFKGYHLGGEFESKSLMKQIIKLNEAINKRKCQIQDIIDGTSVPQWVVDPSVGQEQVEKITSKPGLKIRIRPDLIRKEPASAIPASTFEDLLHTERKFDDLVGLHEVSYGATSKKRTTKGEVELLRESDITPIRLLMRNSESAIIELINWWVQLMKLFYDQEHYVGQLGREGEITYGQFLTREEIPDNLLVTIKVGSTMPVSRETRRLQYLRDFQMGAISLLDYLKFMDYPNPEKLAQNVMAQRIGQITPQGGGGATTATQFGAMPSIPAE